MQNYKKYIEQRNFYEKKSYTPPHILYICITTPKTILTTKRNINSSNQTENKYTGEQNIKQLEKTENKTL